VRKQPLRGRRVLQHRLLGILLRLQCERKRRLVLAGCERNRGSERCMQSLWFDLWSGWDLFDRRRLPRCTGRHDRYRLRDLLF
jgi:hypothetical protein